jgi:hypothetical protein
MMAFTDLIELWRVIRQVFVRNYEVPLPEQPDLAQGPVIHPDPSLQPGPRGDTGLPAAPGRGHQTAADPVPSTAAMASAGGAATGRMSSEPGSRRRDGILWMWPVVAVVIMAAAGAAKGPFGSLLACVALTATIVSFVGFAVLSPRFLVGVLIACLLAIGAIVTGHELGVRALTDRPNTATASPASPPGYAHSPRITTEMIRSGSARGAFIPGAVFDGDNVPGADLVGIVAPGALMRNTTLDGGHLNGANLEGARMRHVHLAGADLRGADLRGADLRGADLRDADLRDACLIGADLTGALLGGADASGSAIAGATVTRGAVAHALWPKRVTTNAIGCP